MTRIIASVLFAGVVLFCNVSSYSQDFMLSTGSSGSLERMESPANINKPNIIGPAGLQINSFSGGLYYERTDLKIPCRGISIDLTFHYNTTNNNVDLGYGNGWSMTYSMNYVRKTDTVIIRNSDGREDTYKFNGSGWTAPIGIFDILTEFNPGQFKLTTKEGMNYFFEDATHKRLTKISEPNNNMLTISYTGNLPTTITDPQAEACS